MKRIHYSHLDRIGHRQQNACSKNIFFTPCLDNRSYREGFREELHWLIVLSQRASELLSFSKISKIEQPSYFTQKLNLISQNARQKHTC